MIESSKPDYNYLVSFSNDIIEKICKSKDGNINICEYINLEFLAQVKTFLKTEIFNITERQIQECIPLHNAGIETIYSNEIKRRQTTALIKEK